MINFGALLKDFEGNVLKEGEKEINLKNICVNALLSEDAESQKEDGTSKVKRFNLAQQIHAAVEPIHLESEDKTLLKKKIASAFSTIVVGQAFNMIEGVIEKVIPAPVVEAIETSIETVIA